MGTPKSNPEGYKEGSVLTHVGKIKGSLLIIHGMMDENVHARHSMRLIDALTEANVKYDLMLFPQERHVPRSVAGKAYMEGRIKDFFASRLLGRERTC